MRRTPAKAKPKTTVLVVRPSALDKRRAILRFGPLVIPAALGRSGITSRKREGDGATPRASMKILSGYRRGDRPGTAATRLPMKRIGAEMLWCDASGHAAYNRPVRAPFAASPFTASHERMKRDDHLYDVCIVLDWNISMRRRGCGSAIFFHLARPGYTPTEGCVAIARRDMLRLLPHLSTDMRLIVP